MSSEPLPGTPIASRVRGLASFVARSTFLTAKGVFVAHVKYGRDFRDQLNELERTQWLSADALRRLQEEKLRRLIDHAYAHIPYYRRVMDDLRLVPGDIRTAADLTQLPLLTKDILRNMPEEFVMRGVPRHLTFPGWTTGSTGSPINALRSRESIVFENAMIWRQRQWAGVFPGDRKAAIWGTVWENMIVPATGHQQPPYWRWNLAENQLLFSYHHMTEKTLDAYVDRLASAHVVSLEGFPSTLMVVAQHLRRRGRTLPLKAVFTSSEPLYLAHRKVMEDRFCTRLFDLYGQAERVVAATECEAHAGLHLNQEYGITEILKDGVPCRDGEVGEIVGTGLNNFIMPLIRYRTGDLARLTNAPCPCGRQMPRIEGVEGRIADLIRTPDGRSIPGNGIMNAFHGIANVKQTLVVQEELSTLIVRIEKEQTDSVVDLETLRKNLAQIVGSRMEIRFELGTGLILQAEGKNRWVVSKLPRI